MRHHHVRHVDFCSHFQMPRELCWGNFSTPDSFESRRLCSYASKPVVCVTSEVSVLEISSEMQPVVAVQT